MLRRPRHSPGLRRDAACPSVTVPMMHIRIVRVAVGDRLMLMRVRMRLAAIPVEVVYVLMMAVVPVHVLMLEKTVAVLVIMMLGEVQPDAHCHQDGRDAETDRERFMEQTEGERRADERGGGEVSAGTCGAKAA